jgi:hypothetical protein
MGKMPTTSYYVWPALRLACGPWRCCSMAKVRCTPHFVVFKYDGHGIVTVKVFDDTMCHCHYHTDDDD